MSSQNCLYYGDNLDVLRRHVDEESVDLVYLDPPFKSEQNYNVLFAEQDGTRAAAQIKAFEDTWQWDQEAAAAYEGSRGHDRLPKLPGLSVKAGNVTRDQVHGPGCSGSWSWMLWSRMPVEYQ